jgi:hypothetical protein
MHRQMDACTGSWPHIGSRLGSEGGCYRPSYRREVPSSCLDQETASMIPHHDICLLRQQSIGDVNTPLPASNMKCCLVTFVPYKTKTSSPTLGE